jgi:hypothetical protein
MTETTEGQTENNSSESAQIQWKQRPLSTGSKVNRSGNGKAGNLNAMSHGLYIDLDSTILRQDARRTLPRLLRQAQAAFCRALGGTPSPQQFLLINRIVFIVYRVVILEGLMATDRTFERDDLYLRYSRELRENLKAIGLSERQGDVIDLQTYLRQKATEVVPAAEEETTS